MIYTAVFGSVEAPKESDASAESDAPETPGESSNPDDTSVTTINWAELKTPLLIGGIMLIIVIGGGFALRKIRRR